jgi:hypothetical protein
MIETANEIGSGVTIAIEMIGNAVMIGIGVILATIDETTAELMIAAAMTAIAVVMTVAETIETIVNATIDRMIAVEGPEGRLRTGALAVHETETGKRSRRATNMNSR